MELRELKAADVWQLVRILGKLRIKEFAKTIDKKDIEALDYKKPMMRVNGKEVPLPKEKYTEAQIEAETRAEIVWDKLMMDVIGFLIENMGNCEYDVNKLLAMGTGSTTEEISAMDAIEYIELIEQYIYREGFYDFFMRAWKLLDRNKPQLTHSTNATRMSTNS